MHEEEKNELVPCLDCGDDFAPGSDGGLGLPDEGYVCAGCCVRRGGQYDAVHDNWFVDPDVSDLMERYGRLDL